MYSTSHQPISVADFGWMLNYVKHLIWLISNFPGTYLPMKMEQTECSETSAYKIQAPGTRPKESIHNIWYDFVYKICVFLLISIFFFGVGRVGYRATVFRPRALLRVVPKIRCRCYRIPKSLMYIILEGQFDATFCIKLTEYSLITLVNKILAHERFIVFLT